MNSIFIIIVLIVFVLIIAAVLVVIGLRETQQVDPLEARLAEFAERGEAASLSEIEMSQSFVDRVVIPLASNVGEIALRFTPQRALDQIEKKLERAGNPRGVTPTTFFAARFIVAVIVGVLMIFVFSVNGTLFTLKGLVQTLLFTAIGFAIPNMMVESKIVRRQNEVTKALPDALDLLTICVEAGLGFEAAMRKVNEKWDNELGMAFGRSLKEITLGKVRRDALRDMADRIGASTMDSFIAAVIQSEQLGVSMAKILRIQSDDMRVKRRQRAEAEAQKAPIKMLFPMALLIFPTIMLILLGPAGLIMMRQSTI
ncbi:MAG: type II secretion system F family protein [Chloroflexota bacterium]